MSRKWQRVKAWDDQHLRGAWTPLRLTLRLFSSVWFGIGLLVVVALYGVVASVPIGLLALGPTWAVYIASLLATLFVVALVPTLLMRLALGGVGRGVRFSLTVFALLGLGVAAAGGWYRFVWPLVHYDPITGSGFRLFPDFVRDHLATTARRLPGFEMTELEFYAWWPLRMVLLLFVTNMIVATVRRIEFNLKNLGVLTVHTGIVVIAFGSILYGRFKKEGDTILFAAAPTAPEATPGRAQTRFYDNTEVVLYVAQQLGLGGQPRWEQRLIRRMPRYNEYALDAGVPGRSYWSSIGRLDARQHDRGRALALDVPPGAGQFVDPDVRFRIVGYAPYAEPAADWIERAAHVPGDGSDAVNPMRIVELQATLPPEMMDASTDGTARFRFPMMPERPADRVRTNAVIGLEYRFAMAPERFAELATPLPAGTEHGLLISAPRPDGTRFETAVPVRAGERFELPAIGWSVGVKELHPTPPFPIITPGYEGATSSVAVLELSRLDEAGGDRIERWVYHRFPELDQDLAGTQEDGRPIRADADEEAIRIRLLDASKLQVFYDEDADGGIRAIVRQPGGDVRVVGALEGGSRIDQLMPNDEGASIDLEIVERWAHAQRFDRPDPVLESEQDRRFVGTHDRAMAAVEVWLAGADGAVAWSSVVWLPFQKYMGIGLADPAVVTLPDGRSVRVAFGRRQHRFPGFQIEMLDFEMIAYDHRGAPRDYQSVVRVAPSIISDRALDIEPYDHVVKLNNPLRAPFHWDDGRSWLFNAARRLAGGLNPNQFKLSQAGWDQQGWQQTQELVDQGLLDRPRVQFTILGVGNNAGIHVIALGSIMMGVGIPWAFYVKPWMVRRERRRLQAAHVGARQAGSTAEAKAGRRRSGSASERAAAGAKAEATA